MKFKFLFFMLIACSIVICATACNPSPSLSIENPSAKETQNTASEAIGMQTTILESETENSPTADSIPLIFTDYSDFVLFGTKGALDSGKYPNAEILINNYQLNRAAFVDIKGLFNLPNEITREWSEEIVIDSKNEYTYYVYSKDESNNLKTEYRITVKYDDDSSNKKTYHESIVAINQMAEMSGHSGTFVFKTNGFDVLYYKTVSGYKSFTLIDDSLSIGVFFEGEGLTEAQIAAKCGSSISELFAEDIGAVGQEVTQMFDFVHESQSGAKN